MKPVTAEQQPVQQQRTVTLTVPDARTAWLSVLAAAAAIAVGWLLDTAADLWIPGRWLNGWATLLAPILAAAAIAAAAIAIRRRSRAEWRAIATRNTTTGSGPWPARTCPPGHGAPPSRPRRSQW